VTTVALPGGAMHSDVIAPTGEIAATLDWQDAHGGAFVAGDRTLPIRFDATVSPARACDVAHETWRAMATDEVAYRLCWGGDDDHGGWECCISGFPWWPSCRAY
jgi:hypothetical protein